jgi:hypothetical protein
MNAQQADLELNAGQPGGGKRVDSLARECPTFCV